MKAVRGLMIVVVLLELALIVVFLEARQTRLRYALAKKQEAVRRLTQENRALTLEAAKARRPDELHRRAAQFGLPIGTERGDPRRP